MCEEMQISETLQAAVGGVSRLEKSHRSGNEGAFRVSLQLLRPIFLRKDRSDGLEPTASEHFPKGPECNGIILC
jgi:hypothetical protein